MEALRDEPSIVAVEGSACIFFNMKNPTTSYYVHT